MARNANNHSSPTEDADFGGRLARVETAVESIQQDLASNTEATRQIASEMHRAIAGLSRTNWPTYAAWSGVIVIVMGAIGSPFIRDLTRIEGTEMALQSEAHAREVEMAKSEGLTTEWRHDVADRLVELDRKLQDEYRAAIAGTESRVSEIDKRLQGEIQRSEADLGQQNEVRESQAAHTEQLRALERAMDRGGEARGKPW
jgi:hypothetical protein